MLATCSSSSVVLPSPQVISTKYKLQHWACCTVPFSDMIKRCVRRISGAQSSTCKCPCLLPCQCFATRQSHPTVTHGASLAYAPTCLSRARHTRIAIRTWTHYVLAILMTVSQYCAYAPIYVPRSWCICSQCYKDYDYSYQGEEQNLYYIFLLFKACYTAVHISIHMCTSNKALRLCRQHLHHRLDSPLNPRECARITVDKPDHPIQIHTDIMIKTKVAPIFVWTRF